MKFLSAFFFAILVVIASLQAAQKSPPQPGQIGIDGRAIDRTSRVA
jgi:hypothetical protein